MTEKTVDILCGSTLSEITRWLVTSNSSSAVQTLAFFDRALGHLSREAFARVRMRLQSSDAVGVDSVLHELLAFEVCHNRGLAPALEPAVNGQTPDLSFQVNGTTILVDVFGVYRPTRTLLEETGAGGKKFSGYRDSGESAKKIADTISKKATKYKKLNAPFVVFVVFGEYSIGLNDLEAALFGASLSEYEEDGLSIGRCHPDWHQCGILCPPNDDASHSSLSAVVSCEWFDTLNRSDRGKRLRLIVYHHWKPTFALAPGMFAPFCDVIWRADDAARVLRPDIVGDPSQVMSTTSDDPPRIKAYSTADPW